MCYTENLELKVIDFTEILDKSKKNTTYHISLFKSLGRRSNCSDYIPWGGQPRGQWKKVRDNKEGALENEVIQMLN